MKAYNRSNPKTLRREIARLAPEVMQEEQQKALARCQYFMLIAMNRALGIGPKRFQRIIDEYPRVLAWYEDAKSDGVEEYKLLQELQRMGLGIKELYPR